MENLKTKDNFEYLKELRLEVEQDFGRLPVEVLNLFDIIELKILAKKAHLTNIKAVNVGNQKLGKMIVLSFTKQLKPENIMNMLNTNSKWQISSDKLKIYMKDLGVVWIPALKDSVTALGESIVISDSKKVAKK